MVRLRHKSVAQPGREVIAVTGAAAGLGRALVERLAAREDLRGLVGIDVAGEGRAVDGVIWRTVDVRDPTLATRLTGVTTLVHLGTSYDVTLPAEARWALNVRGTSQVLTTAREAGVARVVLCTSAEVYGAHPGNAVPLPDGAPLAAEPDEGTVRGEHVEVERLASHAQRSGLAVTVLRPATLVGLDPDYDAQVLRQLSGARLLAVRGVEPLWQLCHVDDLVSALELAALGVVTGGLGVACPGSIPQRVVEELTGRRRLELPAVVAVSTAERLHRAGITTASPRELDSLLGPLVLGCDGLLAAGWTAGWSNTEALLAHLTARAGDPGRGQAVTAAGATVALLGTAALVRQARRRRRAL